MFFSCDWLSFLYYQRMAKTIPPMPVLESMAVHRGWRHVISSAMPVIFPDHDTRVVSPVAQDEAGGDARSPIVFAPALEESPRIMHPQLLESAVVRLSNAEYEEKNDAPAVTRVDAPRTSRFTQSGYRPQHLCYQAHPSSAKMVGKSSRRETFPVGVFAGAVGMCLLLMAISLYFLSH
jgi:hypothetical protein